MQLMPHDRRMRRPIRQIPPDTVVAALVRAGVSLPTALAMERYKADEILDLLRVELLADVVEGAAARGTL